MSMEGVPGQEGVAGGQGGLVNNIYVTISNRSQVLEGSLSKFGTPPPHNFDTLHRPVASFTQTHIFIRQFFFTKKYSLFSNVIKFVFGFIPKFQDIISEMKNNQMYEIPSLLIFQFQTCLLLKTFIKENEYMLPLRHMAKNDLLLIKIVVHFNFKLDI